MSNRTTHSTLMLRARCSMKPAQRQASDGMREKDGNKLSLVWVMGDAHAHYAELLQAHVREAGFDVPLPKGSPTQYVEAARTGESNVGTNGWISSDPVVLDELFHSKNIDPGTGRALPTLDLDQDAR